MDNIFSVAFTNTHIAVKSIFKKIENLYCKTFTCITQYYNGRRTNNL